MEYSEQSTTHERHRLARRMAIGASVLLVAGIGFGGAYFAQHQPAEQNPAQTPPHSNNTVTATVFWIGEQAGPENDYIDNITSAWYADWPEKFGGTDDPEDRCGYAPCDFTPKENPFYFALPFTDYTESGPRPAQELRVVPWFDGAMEPGTSILKNQWVKISANGKTAYAQWEDVGPFEDDDPDYVFGDAAPKETRAGIDLSPATADYLGIDGRGTVSWEFVEADKVPDGPWTQTVTTSAPDYS